MRSGAMQVQSIPRPEISTPVIFGFMVIERRSGPAKLNVIYEMMVKRAQAQKQKCAQLN